MKIITSNNISLMFVFIFSVLHVEVMALVNNESVVSDTTLDDSSYRKSWYFDAYLDDDIIGYHTFDMYEKNGETIIKSEAVFNVNFLFITVYSYLHNNIEIWSNNCLKKLNSTTDDNGNPLSVKLFKEDGNIYIETEGFRVKKKSCVRSFAYWDSELIKSNSLLNSQTGELIDISFRHLGEESYELNNKLIETERYQLRGSDRHGKEIEIDLWYASGTQWVALRSKLDNGNTLRYQLNMGVAQ